MPFDSVDSPPPTITQERVVFCEQKGSNLLIGIDCAATSGIGVAQILIIDVRTY